MRVKLTPGPSLFLDDLEEDYMYYALGAIRLAAAAAAAAALEHDYGYSHVAYSNTSFRFRWRDLTSQSV